MQSRLEPPALQDEAADGKEGEGSRLEKALTALPGMELGSSLVNGLDILLGQLNVPSSNGLVQMVAILRGAARVRRRMSGLSRVERAPKLT